MIKESAKDQIVSLIKHAAMALHLMPKTMRGKEFFKRIFFGRLVPLPPEVEEGMAEYVPPVLVSSNAPNLQYKALYAIARVF